MNIMNVTSLFNEFSVYPSTCFFSSYSCSHREGGEIQDVKQIRKQAMNLLILSLVYMMVFCTGISELGLINIITVLPK